MGILAKTSGIRLCTPFFGRDFHTKVLDEHWDARHPESREQIQAKIDAILSGTVARNEGEKSK